MNDIILTVRGYAQMVVLRMYVLELFNVVFYVDLDVVLGSDEQEAVVEELIL